MSLFDLTGKVAVVTGGAGLIGHAVSVGLAKQGAEVVILDNNLDAIRTREFERAHDKTLKGVIPIASMTSHVASPEMAKSSVEQIVIECGHIDILFNNAATKGNDAAAFFAPFEDYSLATWNAIMATNVGGMFLMAQAVGTQMVKQRTGGSIIQTSSIYGLVGPDNHLYREQDINCPAVYSASKAAIVGLTKWLATYWGEQGIRVNTLVPGGVESGQNAQFQIAYRMRVPLKRMAQHDELTGAVIYLASEASSYVTGQTLVVDGGWTAW